MYSAAADKQEQRAVNQEIKKLTNRLEDEKEASSKEYSKIKEMEQKLGAISNKQYQTEKKIKSLTKKLQEAVKKKQVLQTELDQQKEALAQQLQALYSAGEQSHLRLLLRQDDPSEISRMMKYFEYLNKSRVKKIKKAQGTFEKLKKVETSIQQKQLSLQTLTNELDAQEKDIKRLLVKRSSNLKRLRASISGQEKRLKRLQIQEEKLQTVVNQVAEKPFVDKPEITKLENKKQIAKGKLVKTHVVANKPMTQLKGKLSWPVTGNIIKDYGAKRNSHQKWNGVVLAAAGGTKVRAIAKGEVVFADWMDGYGYLIIIQHDKNYLSLYGYNRSVYKKEGERVKANEVIAAVGNSGGQSQNALYFEIRKGRQPQNPSRWCTNKK